MGRTDVILPVSVLGDQETCARYQCQFPGRDTILHSHARCCHWWELGELTIHFSVDPILQLPMNSSAQLNSVQ